MYAANPVTVFAHTSVWSRQRAFRQARAEKIAQVRRGVASRTSKVLINLGFATFGESA